MKHEDTQTSSVQNRRNSDGSARFAGETRPMQLKSLAGINFVTRIVGETRSKIVAIRKTVWRLAVRGMVTVVPR